MSTGKTHGAASCSSCRKSKTRTHTNPESSQSERQRRAERQGQGRRPPRGKGGCGAQSAGGGGGRSRILPPAKSSFEDGGKKKDSLRQKETEGMFHQQTCLVRNSRRNSLERRQRSPSREGGRRRGAARAREQTKAGRRLTCSLPTSISRATVVHNDSNEAVGGDSVWLGDKEWQGATEHTPVHACDVAQCHLEEDVG